MSAFTLSNFGTLTEPQQKLQRKKKNDQQCAAMLSALLSIFESPISSHPPSQRVCVSDETFGENLTKHTMKANELDPTMQRDPV